VEDEVEQSGASGSLLGPGPRQARYYRPRSRLRTDRALRCQVWRRSFVIVARLAKKDVL